MGGRAVGQMHTSGQMCILREACIVDDQPFHNELFCSSSIIPAPFLGEEKMQCTIAIRRHESCKFVHVFHTQDHTRQRCAARLIAWRHYIRCTNRICGTQCCQSCLPLNHTLIESIVIVDNANAVVASARVAVAFALAAAAF